MRKGVKKEGPVPVRTSISLLPDIMRKGIANAQSRGFGHSFSAYLAWLITRDTEGGVTREDAPTAAAPRLLIKYSSQGEPVPKVAEHEPAPSKKPRAKR